MKTIQDLKNEIDALQRQVLQAKKDGIAEIRKVMADYKISPKELKRALNPKATDTAPADVQAQAQAPSQASTPAELAEPERPPVTPPTRPATRPPVQPPTRPEPVPAPAPAPATPVQSQAEGQSNLDPDLSPSAKAVIGSLRRVKKEAKAVVKHMKAEQE